MIAHGIAFPTKATATYLGPADINLTAAGKIVVRNTPEQLDLLANLLERVEAADKDAANRTQLWLARGASLNLARKLRSIFLSLDFTNATLAEATHYLNLKSRELDPDKKGVAFMIDPQASQAAKPISLILNNVPLGDAVRYVCQLARVGFKVRDDTISIVPSTSTTDELISCTFIVPASFVAPPQTAAGKPSTVQGVLESKGIRFPPSASSVYTPTTGQLTVVDTADQMELLEELVNAGQSPALIHDVHSPKSSFNFDLLNNPVVLTNGENHTVDNIRVFPYPGASEKTSAAGDSSGYP